MALKVLLCSGNDESPQHSRGSFVFPRMDENKALGEIFVFVTCTSPGRMGGVRNHCFRINQSEYAQLTPSIKLSPQGGGQGKHHD
jgi:hypothetical protein